jgi:hypothetical protein
MSVKIALVRSEVKNIFYEKFRMETRRFSGFMQIKRLPAKELLVTKDVASIQGN